MYIFLMSISLPLPPKSRYSLNEKVTKVIMKGFTCTTSINLELVQISFNICILCFLWICTVGHSPRDYLNWVSFERHRVRRHVTLIPQFVYRHRFGVNGHKINLYYQGRLLAAGVVTKTIIIEKQSCNMTVHVSELCYHNFILTAFSILILFF